MRNMERREFLRLSGGLSLTPGWAGNEKPQSFFAGFAVLAGMRSTVPDFWRACDDCAALGFRYIETDNSGLRLAEAYQNRTTEFRDEMSQRGLTLAGLAQAAALSDPARRRETRDRVLQAGRFLRAVGGKYIAALFSPPRVPGLDSDQVIERMTPEDYRQFASLANDLGRRLREDMGIRFGYHVEGPEYKVRMHERILDLTRAEWFDFIPDTGHLQSAGLDALKIFETWRSRMSVVHFKDYDPDLAWERQGRRGQGTFVELGRGRVSFAPLVAFLKETAFTGYVMGELDGQPERTEAMRDYMVRNLNLRLELGS